MAPHQGIIERLLERDFSLLDEKFSPPLYRELIDIDLENPMALYLILSAIEQSQFLEAVPWVLDMILSQQGGYCDPEARLFMHAELPLEMITFVVNTASSRFSLAAVIDSLISLDSNDEVFGACRRAVQVLGDTDFASWISFANEADFQGNTMVWLFCQREARRVAPFAPRPAYMREVTQRTLCEVDESAREPELFRVWGPSNMRLGASADDVADGTADLRMFTDDRFTPSEQGTWFTGSCDWCWTRIQSPRYAVRKPIESGGWRGQYCSWDCVRLDCAEFEEVGRQMTFFYDKQCSEFGIYDHIFAHRGDPDGNTMPSDRASTLA